MVHLIDAGYGMSLRCAIGEESSVWLMNSDNLLKWVSGGGGGNINREMGASCQRETG